MSFPRSLVDKKSRNQSSFTSSDTNSTAISTILKKIEVAEKRKLSISYNCEDSSSDVSSDGACALEVSATDSNRLREKKISLAKRLTEPSLLWSNHFSGVIDDAMDAVVESTEENEEDYSHSEEINEAITRGEHRFANVCRFPLKLILTPLKRGCGLASAFSSLLSAQFGPLHAALQVGNVVLEWNDSSLVIPHNCKYEDQVMEVDMQPHSKWVEHTSKHHSTIEEATKKLDFAEQIDQIYIVTSEKKQLIDALIDVIIKYNKRYYYHLFSRNCQHFVSDALKALEVEEPTAFTGGLKGYFTELVKGCTPSIPKEFETHQDLDKYVVQMQEGNRIAQMPQHDLEFLLTLYFRFHLEHKKKLERDDKVSRQWKCQERNCQMSEIERLIIMESLLVHKFKTISHAP